MLFSRFEKLAEPFPESPGGSPPPDLAGFCLYHTRGLRWPLFAMSLLSMALALVEVYLFGFMGQLVDWLSTRSPDTLLRDEWLTLAGIGVLLLCVLPAIVILHSLLVHQTLLGNFPMAIRWHSHRYLLGQSISFFHNEFAGRIATKLMQTALAVRESVMKTLDILVYVSFYFFGILWLMWDTDWRMVVPFAIWLALYALLLRLMVPRLGAVSEQQADARAAMTGRLVDTYTNAVVVKLFSQSTRESSHAHQSMRQFLDTVYRQMRLVTTLNVLVWIANAVLVFVVGSLAIALWLNGEVSAGSLAVAISLSLRLNGMSQWIMWEVSGLFENIGTVRDGISTFTRPVDVRDRENAGPLELQHGRIEFDRVRFGYDPAEPLFDGLDLQIAPGEKVGLVGRSGAGKSTLVNLLLRFYELQGGEIRIDGQNIQAVTQQSLRAGVGMVTQDAALLHRSVRDNIRYGRPDASDAEIVEAARAAEAHEFILQLRDVHGRRGYDAHVGERGVNLSGGQRQRIAIARVLLKNAPVLVLDEATSALDSEAEASIQECLSRLMQGKTVIAIAHRLSTIAAMDRLLVLDQGRIIESGSHAELLALDGIYAMLWRHQSGGFIGLE